MANAVTWTDVAQVGLVAAQLLVLVAAAIFAWRQVKEARELREEQNRPFVVVDFDVEGGDSLVEHLQLADVDFNRLRNHA